MSDFAMLVARMGRINRSVGEVFKEAHRMNAEAKGEVETLRELSGRLSAAYYDMTRALESAKLELQRREGLAEAAKKAKAST